MSPPKVTIGIPAFGRPLFLREAIQSSLAQTYSPLEILVADDCSPQDPWPQIADLQSERWSYLRHEKNLGGPGNFNNLIDRAQGDYFILHQDDDLLHPDFCSRAVEALEADPEAVLYSGWMLRGPNLPGCLGYDLQVLGGPWQPLDYLKAGPHRIESLDAQLSLLFGIAFMHPAVAMRRSALRAAGGYFAEFMHGSDNITFIRMLAHGHLLYDTRISGLFRLHGKNVSTSQSDAYQHKVRRRVVRELWPILERQGPVWPIRLKKLLLHLRRRDRWILLRQAVEAGYPETLVRIIAQSIGKRTSWNILRTRLFKASYRQQWLTRMDKSEPQFALRSEEPG